MDFLLSTLALLGLSAALLVVCLTPLLAVIYGFSWLIAKREAAAALNAGSEQQHPTAA